MGATYTRQSGSEIVDGEVINASDFNNEFNTFFRVDQTQFFLKFQYLIGV